jgi:quercetin dioxygenase-like cupin family protein
MQTAFVRPYKPVELTASTLDAFDVQALAQQLTAEDPFTEHGRNGLTLALGDPLTIVLTVAKTGKMAIENHPPGPAILVVLWGSLSLSPQDGQSPVRLSNNQFAAFAPDLVHTVEIHADCAFLTIIGGKTG